MLAAGFSNVSKDTLAVYPGTGVCGGIYGDSGRIFEPAWDVFSWNPDLERPVGTGDSAGELELGSGGDSAKGDEMGESAEEIEEAECFIAERRGIGGG